MVLCTLVVVVVVATVVVVQNAINRQHKLLRSVDN